MEERKDRMRERRKMKNEKKVEEGERREGVKIEVGWYGGIRGCGNVVFFFQAEDGIRDRFGVQTCALPIWPAMVP